MDENRHSHHALPPSGFPAFTQPSTIGPAHMSTSNGFISRQEPTRSETSQVRPPSLPAWARPRVVTPGQPESVPVSQRSISPAKQGSIQEAERYAERSPSASQFMVQLKSSPLRQPALYQKVDDGPLAAATSALAQRGRKRPQPGAMGVRNMFAAALGVERGGGVNGYSGEAAASGGASMPSTPASMNKRGRPKGWKPGMSYSAIRGNPAPKTPRDKGSSGQGLPRGRKPTTISNVVRRQYLCSQAEFAPFVCEWLEEDGERCPAELQNLETLRRHLFQVHVVDRESSHEDYDGRRGKANHAEAKEDEHHTRQICRWAKCAQQVPPTDHISEDALDDHIEWHLTSIAWHVGDGHQNRLPSVVKQDVANNPAYLLGKNGIQITPSIQEQSIETDQQRKDRKRRLRHLEMQRDDNAPNEDEFLKQTLGATVNEEVQ
ncbi:chromatin structure-remodeling complex subunit RSC9 [Microdochium nivale]|nr:chromatin structure-remodeling complex subunit RSC9 [Microdochium nivale]